MGLLDNVLGTSWDDPKTMAALQLAGGLLGGQGNTMQRLALGLNAYGATMGAAKKAQQEEEERKAIMAQRALQARMLEAQFADQLRAREEAAAAKQARGSFLDSIDPNAGPAMPLSVPQAMRAGLGLQEIQALEARQKAEAAEAFRRSIPSPQGQALGSLGVDASPTAANAARMQPVDQRQQLMFDAMKAGQISPMDYLNSTAKDTTPIKLGANERLLDPRNNRVLVDAMPDPAKMSPVAQLMTEMNALPPGDPRRAIYQNAISKATTHQPATNLSVNTGDNKFEAKAGEVIANQFAETYKQGQGAVRALGQVNRLDQLLQKTGGGFTPAVKMYAGQFGVNTAGLDDIQAAEAIIQSLIPQQRPPGSGTMSDRDVELFRQSLPRMINQPGGNKKILDTMRGLYEYDQKLGRIASDALAGKISRERAMELMNEVPNPLAYLTSGSDVRSQADAIINRGRP